jgi:aminoglycoside phosphotransferase (APT) family kinase protein
MSTAAGALELAGAMGALLPRLADVATAGARLGSAWAHPERLTHLARRRLDRCRPLLDAAAVAALEATIDEVPARFVGRAACFAHGDFCPVNVLVADGRPTTDERPRTKEGEPSLTPLRSSLQPPASTIVALVDLEFARIADPLFDAAWWGWVVRYHHPERWVQAWPRLLAAAGIAEDAATLARVRVLQRLRCLEMLDDCARTRTKRAVGMWRERLTATLGWA